MTKLPPDLQKLYDKMSPQMQAVADKLMAENDTGKMAVVASTAGLRCGAEAFKRGQIDLAQLGDLNSAILKFIWLESTYNWNKSVLESFAKDQNIPELILTLTSALLEGEKECCAAGERFKNLMELVKPEGF